MALSEQVCFHVNKEAISIKGEAQNWRQEARRALRVYPELKRRQTDINVRITPSYSSAAIRRGFSRSTENAALRAALTAAEENIVMAVEVALQMQRESINGKEREEMIRVVYFAQSHTVEGAADILHYSPDALWRWNAEILTAVHAALLAIERTRRGQ